MAMTLDTAIKFTAKLEGTGLDQLKRNLQGLSQQSNVSKRSLDQLYTATQKLGAASGNTISGLQTTVGALKALRDQAEFGSRQFKILTRDIEAAEARLRKFQGAAGGGGGISRGNALLAGVAGGVAAQLTGMAVGAAGAGVRGITQVGLDAESARVRLRALANEFGEYNAAQQAAARIAQTLRLSTTEAEQGFASLYASLRPTGISIQELEKAYIGFTAAARNSGATAQETSNALIQLKQGLASGALQGEELRSIREQAPLVAQAIAKEFGVMNKDVDVSIGNLKDFAAEGKITTEVVLRALSRLSDNQLGKLQEQFNTGQQAVKDFQIAAEDVGRTISRIFGPTAVSLLRGFTRALKEANDVLGGLTGDGDAGRRAQLRVQAQQRAAAEAQGRFGIFSFQQGSKNQFFLERQQKIYEELLKADQTRQEKDKANADQLKARADAAAERDKTRRIAEEKANEDRVKAAEDEAKIRLDTERRLADFREQSIQRAKDLERSLGDQRLELERSTAEARRRITAQQEDFRLEAERQRLRGAGLGTDALDVQARLNEATRRYTEQRIQIEQNATDKKVQLERTLADYQLTVARGISEILQDAGRKLADHMRKGANDAANALTGTTATIPNVRGGAIPGGARTNRRRDPDGEATGWDIVMPGGRGAAVRAPLELTITGTGFQGRGAGPSGRGYGNYVTGEFTLGDKKYELLLGHFDRVDVAPGMKVPAGGTLGTQGITGRTSGSHVTTHVNPRGGASVGDAWNALEAITRIWETGGQRPVGISIPGLPGVTAAGQRLDAALSANTAAQSGANIGDLVASRQSEFTNITSQLDQQRKSVREQREDYERMLVLQRSGLSPETAREVINRQRATEAQRAGLQALEQQVVKDLEDKNITGENRTNLEKILQATRDRLAAQPGINAGLTEEQRQLDQLRQAYERNKQLAEGIAGAIGNGIGSAIDLLIDGTDNWGNSLRQIAANTLKDIARQITQIMVIQPIVKGITKAFGFADGGIMTANGPVPLRTYARGGIANSPQLAMFGEGSMPEAYVPLPDGRRIPVAMKGGGGGGVSVNVNVDASGTQVQGNPGQGEQLGRAVAQAVQAELIRQKRPGGLLAA
jgi:tape measure domain-containing protein